MINLANLRQYPEKYSSLIKRKDPFFDVEHLLLLDATVRTLQGDVEKLRCEKNELAKEARGGVTETLRKRSIEIGEALKKKEHQLQEIKIQFRSLYLLCPNIPDESVPIGDKTQNEVVKSVGEKPLFSFLPHNHLELATKHGWIDFEGAARIAAGNFALYHKQGASLLYSLAFFMLKNNMSYGYELVAPSYLVNETSLIVSGNFPKFKDQVYTVEKDDLYLSPTAEVNLANLYRDYIFSPEELPMKKTAWTSCFRREAGGYGATERGLIRIHQFEKVELFTFCEPKNASQEQDRMIACAEAILQKLDLHYRISLLATQDCSFSSAKTYDIEVWLPGQKIYSEVSSCSNCTDFQSRRGLIRYRETVDSKPELVYTLNASSLALPRLMVALIEVYQQEDGSIELPDILKKEGLFLG